MERSEKLSSKRRFLLRSVIIPVISVVLATLAIVVYMAYVNRQNIALDVTTESFYEISPQTIQQIKAVDKPINITVLATPQQLEEINPFVSSSGSYLLHFTETLESLKEKNSYIDVYYLDFFTYPSFANKHPNLTLESGDVVISTGEKSAKLSLAQLFNTTSNKDGVIIQSSSLERSITTTILNLLDPNPPIIAFAQGYNQSQLSGFMEALEDNDFIITTFDIKSQPIPKDSSVVVLGSPHWDFEQPEIDKLNNFLKENSSNKTLFYVASYTQPEQEYLPKINSLLNDWGITVGDSVVFENETSQLTAFPDLYEFRVNYSDSSLKPRGINPNKKPVVFFAKPMRVRDVKYQNRTAEVLWETTGKSGIFPSEFQGQWQVSERDYSGPIPVLALATQQHSQEISSNVLVLTSDLALDSVVMYSQETANRDYLVELLRNLTNTSTDYFIKDSSYQQQSYKVTPAQYNVVSFVLVVIIPIAITLAAMVTMVRRKAAIKG